MKVLICGPENILKDITFDKIWGILNCTEFTQRLLINKKDYRLYAAYDERADGEKTVLRDENGLKFTVKGTYIILHDEYGVYKDITIEDIGDIMLSKEVSRHEIRVREI